MANDPAFLFYSNDFEAKTKFLTNEQVGKMIRLMITQHQHGHLSREQVEFICNGWDEKLMKKFQVDKDDLYFNDRLEVEINKRKAFCESRRLSRTSHVRKSYVKRMEDENENIIYNKKGVVRGKFVVPTNKEVQLYCLERKNTVDPQRFLDFYTSKGWMIGKNKMKDWKAAVRNWEKSGNDKALKQDKGASVPGADQTKLYLEQFK